MKNDVLSLINQLGPVANADIARNIQADYIHLISEGNTVYVSVHLISANYLMGSDPPVLLETYNLSQTGNFVFNDQGKVVSFQLDVPFLG